MTDCAAARPVVNELELVERLRAGDADAFDEVVRTHGGRLLAVARRLLRDEEDARDAVQDALISAFRGVRRFEGGAQLGTWLHRIVVNAALMRLRTRRRRPEVPIEDLLPQFGADGRHVLVPALAPFPDEQTERNELLRLLREAVERLPGGYREVYLLRDIDELSTEETATALGITPNAVKIRLHRARQALVTLVRARCGADAPIAPGRTR